MKIYLAGVLGSKQREQFVLDIINQKKEAYYRLVSFFYFLDTEKVIAFKERENKKCNSKKLRLQKF